MGRTLKMAWAALGAGKKAGHRASKSGQKKHQQKPKPKPKPKQQQKPETLDAQDAQNAQDSIFTNDELEITTPDSTYQQSPADSPTSLPAPPKVTTPIPNPLPVPPMPNLLPVSPNASVLLFGEGDLSFSLSLHATHNFTSLTSTTFDSHSSLVQKYPQSAQTISTLSSVNHTILHSIDCTRPPKSLLKRSGSFNAIIFLFPHVGGLTKDQDRQIRANQELLLGFFKTAKKLVEPNNGVVIMSTFVGEPYESWDVKGLAKKEGWRVRRSGAFPWESFPGYHHARTLGNIKSGGSKGRGKGDRNTNTVATGSGHGGSNLDDERRGWKGEDRAARMWIFEISDGKTLNASKKKLKRNVPAEFDTDSENEDEEREKGDKKKRKQGQGQEQGEGKIISESREWLKEQAERRKDSSNSKKQKYDYDSTNSNSNASDWKAGDIQSQESQFRKEDDL